jgi:hypothetical protein
LVTCRAAVPCTYELDPTRARMECYIIAGLSSRTQASGLCRSTGENQRRIRDISRIWLPWRDCSCSELRNITYNYIQDIHSIQSGHEAIGKVARYVGRCYPFKLRTRRTVMHPAIRFAGAVCTICTASTVLQSASLTRQQRTVFLLAQPRDTSSHQSSAVDDNSETWYFLYRLRRECAHGHEGSYHHLSAKLFRPRNASLLLAISHVSSILSCTLPRLEMA